MHAPQLATYSWRLPTSATTAVVPTSAALSALPNSSSVRLNASVSALSNFSALHARLSTCGGGGGPGFRVCSSGAAPGAIRRHEGYQLCCYMSCIPGA